MRVRAGVFFLLSVSLPLAGCGGGVSSVSGVPPAARSTQRAPSGSSPITHVVMIVQENRSFNDFFATFPGADGTTNGKVAKEKNCSPPITKGKIALAKAALCSSPKISTIATPDTWRRTIRARWTASTRRRSVMECPSVAIRISIPIPAKFSPIGLWRSSIRWPSTCSPRRAATASPPTRILIRGGTVVQSGQAMIDLPTCRAAAATGAATLPAAPTRTWSTQGKRPRQKARTVPLFGSLSAELPDAARSVRRGRRIVASTTSPPNNTSYGELIERVRRRRRRAQRPGVDGRPHLGSRDEYFQRHRQRLAAGRVVGDSRQQ